MEHLLLFLSSFLAATLLPFSSEAHVAKLILDGHERHYILLAASLGNTAGGMFNFWIGRFGKLEWAEKFLRIKKTTVDSLQSRVKKWGGYIALFCWLPIIGDPLALALGYFRANTKLTLVFMFIGKTLRYMFLIYLISS